MNTARITAPANPVAPIRPAAIGGVRVPIVAPGLRAGVRWRPTPSLATVPLRVLMRAPRPGSWHA